MKRILVKWGIMFLVVGMVLACSVEAKASEVEAGNENMNIGDGSDVGDIGDGSDVGDGSGDVIVDDEIVEDIEEIKIGDKKVTISKKKEKGAPYLEWEEVENAQGYEVQVSAKKDGKYKLLDVVKENTYRSYKLVTCKKKYFRVVPFLVTDEGEIVYGTPSKVKKVNITRVKLKAKCVMQHPELPTGCEATALTIALNYHGFNVKKTTIVDKYLPKVPLGTMVDIDNRFIGNPYSRGMGIYAPGLKKTANKYLKKQNTDLRAKDITGASVNEICKYVAEGYPVCVWSTIDINTKGTVTWRWAYKGKKYEFSRYEHCITVIGFDKEKDTIIVADPTNGMCEHPRKLFTKRYKELKKRAMVIK